METIIETIAEYITKNKKIGILFDIEEWYEDYISNIESSKKLLEDQIFNSIYNYGYNNIDWYTITHKIKEYLNDIDSDDCSD
jgi:hypothetical protein